MTSAALQNPTARAYRSFSALTGSLASVFLLAIRLYWGWQFAETGWGKLHHLEKVTNFFTTLGIPAPGLNAVFVAALEFVGGIALALGFGSRLLAFLLAADMFVAYLTAGRENLLSIFSDPGKFYGDDAFTFLFASLIIMIFGPGKLALDEFLHRSGKF
jgi:putative oxidoreductase